MKHILSFALIAICMASCTNQKEPQRCELFGVSIGMSEEQVKNALTNLFGKGDETFIPGNIHYEDIYHDGLKYLMVDFAFEDGMLSYVFACCDKSLEFADEEEYEISAKTWGLVHEVDSILGQRHKIYQNPFSKGLEDGNVVTIATKDINNFVDFITVSVHRHQWLYNNSESVSLSLNMSEIEK